MDDFLALERGSDSATGAELENCAERLSDVLAVLDDRGVPPEIGARVYEALHSLNHYIEKDLDRGAILRRS